MSTPYAGTDRTYTLEFRDAAVKQVIEDSRDISAVARSLEMSGKTLANWVYRARKGQTLVKRQATKPLSELEAEHGRLRQENFCRAFGEVLLHHPHGKRYSEIVGLHQKQVSAAYVNPGHIAMVRKKLELDQLEAADIFGGGVNASSRYENGKTKPPLALVKLLQVLDRHPDL